MEAFTATSTYLRSSELAKRQYSGKVYVHCFRMAVTHHRLPGKEYVEQLEAKMKEIGVGEAVPFPDVMQWTVITAGIV